MIIGNLSSIIKGNVTNSNKAVDDSLAKLSTGLRITKASDDASGLAISDKLRTQASGIKQSIDNANSAVAMMNIADKSMDELSNILGTIKAKAIQMNTTTTSQEGKKSIKTEILKLIEQYDNIVCSTNYNKTPLLNGCASPFIFQVGNNANDTISVNIDDVESRQMGLADPYKLKNFITGFNDFPATPTPVTPTQTNLNDVLSSNIPGFENFDWNSATKDANGNYVIEDFNSSLVGNQVMSLNGNTYTLLNINSSYIKNIEFTFDGFGAPNERFTLKDGSNIIGEISGNNYTGNEIVNVSLDTSFVGSWDYSNLESNNLGTVTLNDIKKDISVFATGAALSLNKMVITLQDNLPTSTTPTTPSCSCDSTQSLNKMVITLQDNLPTSTTPTTPSCSCDSTQLVRNDDSPTLAIQALHLMGVIDEALNQLNSQRSNVGAGTNQLESSTRNLMTGYVNLKNAESIIRDVDYSSESANFNKANIIAQAGSYVQSQANNVDKQYVVQLLK